MRATTLLAVALCVPLLTASAQNDPQWRSLDVSRQLRAGQREVEECVE